MISEKKNRKKRRKAIQKTNKSMGTKRVLAGICRGGGGIVKLPVLLFLI